MSSQPCVNVKSRYHNNEPKNNKATHIQVSVNITNNIYYKAPPPIAPQPLAYTYFPYPPPHAHMPFHYPHAHMPFHYPPPHAFYNPHPHVHYPMHPHEYPPPKPLEQHHYETPNEFEKPTHSIQLSKENARKDIKVELPPLLKTIFSLLPQAKNYYSCRAKLSGDFTSDIDAYTSADEADIQKIIFLRTIGKYTINEVKHTTYPSKIFTLTLKNDTNSEIQRIDFHYSVKNVVEIGNPNSPFKTNYDANTFIADEEGNVWNCYDFFHTERCNFLETGIPKPIFKKGLNLYQFYEDNPICILLDAFYASQTRKNKSHVANKQEKIEHVNDIIKKIGGLNVVYSFLKNLPKHSIILRMIRAFAYGEGVSNLITLEETGLFEIIILVLCDKPFKQDEINSINKNYKILKENLMNLLNELDNIYDDETKNRTDDDSICAMLLYLSYNGLEIEKINDKNINAFSSFNFKENKKTIELISKIKDKYKELRIRLSPINHTQFSTIVSISPEISIICNEELNAREILKKARKDRKTQKAKEKREAKANQKEEKTQNKSNEYKEKGKEEKKDPEIESQRKEGEKNGVEPEKIKEKKLAIHSNKVIKKDKQNTKIMNESTKISELKSAAEQKINIKIIQENNPNIDENIIQISNSIRVQDLEIKEKKLTFKIIVMLNENYSGDYLIKENEITFFEGKTSIDLLKENENLSILEVLNHVCTSRTIDFKNDIDTFLYENKCHFRFGNFKLINGKPDLKINSELCFRNNLFNNFFGIKDTVIYNNVENTYEIKFLSGEKFIGKITFLGSPLKKIRLIGQLNNCEFKGEKTIGHLYFEATLITLNPINIDRFNVMQLFLESNKANFESKAHDRNKEFIHTQNINLIETAKRASKFRDAQLKTNRLFGNHFREFKEASMIIAGNFLLQNNQLIEIMSENTTITRKLSENISLTYFFSKFNHKFLILPEAKYVEKDGKYLDIIRNVPWNFTKEELLAAKMNFIQVLEPDYTFTGETQSCSTMNGYVITKEGSAFRLKNFQGPIKEDNYKTDFNSSEQMPTLSKKIKELMDKNEDPKKLGTFIIDGNTYVLTNRDDNKNMFYLKNHKTIEKNCPDYSA